jgi:hemerythrin
MREFFRGFFGKDSDESLKKSEQEKKDKSKKEVSRRGFLKALGAVGAGAALDSGVRKIYPRVEHAKNIFEAVIDYRKDLLNFEKNIAEEFSSFDLTNHRLSEVTTLEEFEEIRKRIYVKYNSAIIKISQNLLSFFREHSKLSSNDPNIYKFSPSEIESRKFFKEDLLYFYKLLSTFNGQGVLYQCASSQGEYASLLNMLHDSFLDKKDQSEEWGKRFCARAEDFLPRSQEIGNEDIDPFINFSNEGYLLASERKAESKWGKEDYQSAFKKVLDDNNIRSILQKTDIGKHVC